MRFPSLSPRTWTALALAVAGVALFHFAGNTTGGYVRSLSLFAWVGAQWFSPLDDMGHGPLVVLAAGWLIQRAYSGGREPNEAVQGVGSAVAWLIAGLVLHALGALVQMPRVSFFGLLAFVAGVIAWAAGNSVRRRAMGGILLLLLALSWSFVDTWGVNLRLRLAVTTTVYHLLSVGGIDIQRQGTLLLPAGGGAPLEVAAACAGMRSTAAMLTLAWVAAEIVQLAWFRRCAMVCVALATVWVGNVVRVLGLVGLELAGGWASNAVLHTAWGVVVFAGEAAFVLGMTWWLSRRQPQKVADPGEGGVGKEALEGVSTRAYAAPARIRWVAFIATILAMLLLGTWIRLAPSHTVADTSKPALPLTLRGSWVGVDAPLSPLEQSVMPAGTVWERRIYLNPRDRREQVLVTLVWAGGDRTSIHRPELCLTGMGWTVAGRGSVTLDKGTEATKVALTRRSGREGAMVYWFSGDGRVEATYGGMLWQWVRDRLSLRRSAKWGYFAVQTLDIADNGGHTALAAEAARMLWEEMEKPERAIR